MADTVAMKIKMGIAGSICDALFFIPSKMVLIGLGQNTIDNKIVRSVAPRSIK